MIKFPINHSTTHYPLKVLSGNEAQRLEFARKLNQEFYDGLKTYGATGTRLTFNRFINELKKVIKSSIHIEFIPEEIKTCKNGLGFYFGEKGTHEGYNLIVPLIYDTRDVKISAAPLFLKHTQELFNMICNPKFVKRELKLFLNPKSEDAVTFFKNYISGTKQLNEKDLRKFLKGMKPQEKIDILQMLRYSLKNEKNTYLSRSSGGVLNSSNQTVVIKKPETDLNYDEKLDILNKQLLKILQKERKKIKSK